MTFINTNNTILRKGAADAAADGASAGPARADGGGARHGAGPPVLRHRRAARDRLPGQRHGRRRGRPVRARAAQRGTTCRLVCLSTFVRIKIVCA